jgi:hypothetical protein
MLISMNDQDLFRLSTCQRENAKQSHALKHTYRINITLRLYWVLKHSILGWPTAIATRVSPDRQRQQGYSYTYKAQSIKRLAAADDPCPVLVVYPVYMRVHSNQPPPQLLRSGTFFLQFILYWTPQIESVFLYLLLLYITTIRLGG